MKAKLNLLFYFFMVVTCWAFGALLMFGFNNNWHSIGKTFFGLGVTGVIGLGLPISAIICCAF